MQVDIPAKRQRFPHQISAPLPKCVVRPVHLARRPVPLRTMPRRGRQDGRPAWAQDFFSVGANPTSYRLDIGVVGEHLSISRGSSDAWTQLFPPRFFSANRYIIWV
jgi:hypothetical protein